MAAPANETDTRTEVTFQQWLDGVDRLCRTEIGLRLDDLEDLSTRDAYDAGNSVRAFFDEDVMAAIKDFVFDARRVF